MRKGPGACLASRTWWSRPSGFHREVRPGQTYQYQVQAIAGAELGEASPPLSHVHGAPFCGDGKVAR